MNAWEVVGLPPGITTEKDARGPVAVGLRCQCGKTSIVSRAAVEARAGQTAPCFHCFRAGTLPSAQGSLL